LWKIDSDFLRMFGRLVLICNTAHPFDGM
jgi:hypothetical protein